MEADTKKSRQIIQLHPLRPDLVSLNQRLYTRLAEPFLRGLRAARKVRREDPDAFLTIPEEFTSPEGKPIEVPEPLLASWTGRYNRKELSGKKIGRLTVLYPVNERDYKGSVYWHCRCDCGNELDLTEDMLMHGGYVSCGCKKKEQQEQVGSTLTFLDGTCVQWLKNRGRRADNISGTPGVNRLKNGMFKATIGFKKTRFYLGAFPTYEKAAMVREEAEGFIYKAFLERYESWKKEAEEARRRGEEDWEKENPLIFEVSKPRRGMLEVVTSDGILTLEW